MESKVLWWERRERLEVPEESRKEGWGVYDPEENDGKKED